jgi:hypothetical protein
MSNSLHQENIHIGPTSLKINAQPVQGKMVDFQGKPYYCIENYDNMSPFFLSVISDSDIWMFVSSSGALTAGRCNPDNALFPYYNDDRIHDSKNTTGGKTLIMATINGKINFWEPLSNRYEGLYETSRNMYKRPLGNDIIFEEINHDLKLAFYCRWTNCHRFGIVREAAITSLGHQTVTIRILDGIQNILPAGVDRGTQLAYSTLLDGYKKNELLPENGIGIYTLSSLLTDRAEPAESLQSTTVWSAGLHRDHVLLSSTQLDAFRKGKAISTETDIRARRGAYFIESTFELPRGKRKNWFIQADLKQDLVQLTELKDFLQREPHPENILISELQKSDEILEQLVARSDGLQLGRDQHMNFRHFSVTLFNIMRGGIFEYNNTIHKDDFLKFLRTSNVSLYQKYRDALENLPVIMTLNDISGFFNQKDNHLKRLLYEYLPLSFSRRHGDPSRPWNDFAIHIRDEDGNRILNYQGNWRDVFQNWEALALSFPEFIEHMITKFVNSTTADGYNPYRLTRNGFEWETPDPHTPFANIGYWGDHQIVYLLKLLKLSYHFHPGKLQKLLIQDLFTYANVPYRIKPYASLVEDPHHTIDFDANLHNEIMNAMKNMGTDAQRLHDAEGSLILVNLAEKLLVPVLAKLSNFIPGAGIWMNTQRPEWNDANNALVGFGVSMVTLYYLRDHLHFLSDLFGELDIDTIDISQEVYDHFQKILTTFNNHKNMIGAVLRDKDRKVFLDELGHAGSQYRDLIYTRRFSKIRKGLPRQDMLNLFSLVLQHIDHTISLNKRDDGLFHAYHVIRMTDKGIALRKLYEMLEGQVAVLSSGYLSAREALDVLKSLRESRLYRPDQQSYVLYPDRQLPRFTEKNIIPEKYINKSSFLKNSLQTKDTRVVQQDIDGNVHFNAVFSNGRILKQTLEKMDLNASEIDTILDVYESVFDHQSFTGRSGTFFKYEGLGCIYWHMVSKLLLAVQDTYYRAYNDGSDPETLELLKTYYFEIKEGIGSHKNPDEYGAFPMDPYSHTPGYSGVQQPGMTGQTKEDILARTGELGVRIKQGAIHFTPTLLNTKEFLLNSKVFSYFDVENKRQTLMLSENMMAFTICQVPVIYIKSDMEKMIVTFRDGHEKVLDGLTLPASYSSHVFERDNKIIKIHVLLKLL